MKNYEELYCKYILLGTLLPLFLYHVLQMLICAPICVTRYLIFGADALYITYRVLYFWIAIYTPIFWNGAIIIEGPIVRKWTDGVNYLFRISRN